MTIVQDYFAVEPILVEHIRTAMADEINEVNTPFTIEDMLEAANNTPSISVIYFDDRVGENVGNGKLTTIYQQWLIVLCLQDAEAQLQNTNSIRKSADPFIRKLLDTVQGFDPNVKGYKSFKRTNCPVRLGGQSSFAYFPFLFETQIFT